MNTEQPTPPQLPNGITEDAYKTLKAQYADWIQHPTTQLMMTMLQKRKAQYVKTLTDQIQIKSDKEFEDKQRSAITTCEAILRIVSKDISLIAHATLRNE